MLLVDPQMSQLVVVRYTHSCLHLYFLVLAAAAVVVVVLTGVAGAQRSFLRLVTAAAGRRTFF